MAMVLEQGELFPSATEVDIEITKVLLRKYPKMAITVNGLKLRGSLSPKEKSTLKKWDPIIRNIELAIHAILDLEIKEIMQYRFIDRNPRKAALIKWSIFSERSFDRKIQEGTESVAGTLKMLGII
ncbi:hypothetical protein C162_21908 [Paenibacillus sp. FSL R7-269]|uniref:hypothetical protein n=1 Tax=Paenibacillus sp. FSL R7-269 TaxID=1226755 RepID=UPI0003E2938B|nr:hypothetical protein [Paenibacillus sp. FSL R7-269]ETT45236.1 hypothetical protein C162_21908 [Paenibacillus sp. FSL R7-269]